MAAPEIRVWLDPTEGVKIHGPITNHDLCIALLTEALAWVVRSKAEARASAANAPLIVPPPGAKLPEPPNGRGPGLRVTP